MSHTPGPWKFFRDIKTGPYPQCNKWADLWFIESDTRKYMAVLELPELNSDPRWRKANQDKVLERKNDFIEIEANVKLIATAPELLKALKKLLAVSQEKPVPSTDPAKQTDQMLRQIEAEEYAEEIIAKATK